MRKRRNRSWVPLFWLLGILFVFAFFSCIFALIYAANSNIMPNVTINNIKVSGLNKLQAEEKFEGLIDNILEDEIILKHGEYEKTVTLKRMELQADVTDKVYEACTIGRRDNIIANNYKIISVLLNGENVDLEYKFNDKIVESIFNNLDDEWEERFVDNSYYIDENKLIIVRGKTGTIIDKEALKQKIIDLINLKIQGEKISEIEIPVITKTPEEIDIEKIQKEIYKEAKNASYDKANSKLTVHSDGIDIGITIEDAKKLLREEKEEYTIPLRITKPEVLTEMLGEEAFPDVLRKLLYKI